MLQNVSSSYSGDPLHSSLKALSFIWNKWILKSINNLFCGPKKMLVSIFSRSLYRNEWWNGKPAIKKWFYVVVYFSLLLVLSFTLQILIQCRSVPHSMQKFTQKGRWSQGKPWDIITDGFLVALYDYYFPMFKCSLFTEVFFSCAAVVSYLRFISQFSNKMTQINWLIYCHMFYRMMLFHRIK